MTRPFSYIEAPIFQGQKHRGVSLGPAFIRQLLLDQNYQFNCYTVFEKQNQKHIQDAAYEELSYITEREMRRHNLIFIAGGDHSLSIGSLQGILRCEPETKVIWIDAHADINTRKSSLTQAWHGMPLSFLVGLDDYYKKYDWFEKNLDPRNILYLGVRDLDQAEKEFLEKLNITYLSSHEILNASFEKLQSILFDFANESSIHISLDTDAFDPAFAPATGVKVQDGLSFKIVNEIVKQIALISDIKSFEFVELNPLLAGNENEAIRTAQLGIDLFSTIYHINQNKKEAPHGNRHRFSHTKKSILYDSYFEMEK